MPKNLKESNYLQVGQTIECGNCYPKKFEYCKDITKKHPTVICDCVCHNSMNNLKEIENNLIRDICSISVEPAAKSEVRRLVGEAFDEVLGEAIKHIPTERKQKKDRKPITDDWVIEFHEKVGFNDCRQETLLNLNKLKNEYKKLVRKIITIRQTC